jgi:hypothetical protein
MANFKSFISPSTRGIEIWFLALPISMHASKESVNFDIMVFCPGIDPSKE